MSSSKRRSAALAYSLSAGGVPFFEPGSGSTLTLSVSAGSRDELRAVELCGDADSPRRLAALLLGVADADAADHVHLEQGVNPGFAAPGGYVLTVARRRPPR
jgi:hypothetical protein